MDIIVYANQVIEELVIKLSESHHVILLTEKSSSRILQLCR